MGKVRESDTVFISKGIVNNVFEEIDGSLMFQYREGKNLNEELKMSVYASVIGMTEAFREMTEGRVSVSIRDEYKKTHIKKPSKRLANRFRFLFTGKLN